MNLRPAIRWLLRPVVLGALVAAACAAWHFRPLSRDVLIPVPFRDGAWGCVNDAGRVAIPGEWDMLSAFDSAGHARVRKDEKSGWIDRWGSVIIAVEWDAIKDFDSEEFAWVQKERKWCRIDRAGNIALPVVWPSPFDFDAENMSCIRIIDFSNFGMSGLFRTTNPGQSGVIDRTGKLVVPAEWDHVDIQKSGHIVAINHVEPGRLEAMLEKFLAWIRPAAIEVRDRPPILCHVYDRDGQLVWRSDDPTRHLPLLAGAFAGGVAGLDGLRRLWRRWRGATGPASPAA